MREFLVHELRAPHSDERLTVHSFQSADIATGEKDIRDGILVTQGGTRAYPVVHGVPVILEDSFTEEFLRRYETEIEADPELRQLDLKRGQNPDWSFSSEWDYHASTNQNKTWGWTLEERTRQFFLECDVDASEIVGKTILDAGCGNGQLTESLSLLGATVIGVDYSTSVFAAERARTSQMAHYVRGDLLAPPFAPGIFDIIISNGVIHHTPNTYRTFVAVAALARAGGRFYLWLYRKPQQFFRRYFFLSAVNMTRTVVSRLPGVLQDAAVKAFAAGEVAAKVILRRMDGFTWQERVVNTYDNLTPRWRHYHTPLEVASWFFANGYSRAMITHWDNPLGFGMVATKLPASDTPGVNFGKAGVAKRFWA